GTRRSPIIAPMRQRVKSIAACPPRFRALPWKEQRRRNGSMYRSPRYVTDPEEAEWFVAAQRHGYIISTPPDGRPRVTIVPFVKRGDQIEIHMVQEDETFKALQQNPRATFFVSDFLAWSRHDWVDPVDAGRATLNFQAVQYECEATTSTEPADVAAALRGLLEAYEPGASYTPVADNEFYGPRLRRLA